MSDEGQSAEKPPDQKKSSGQKSGTPEAPGKWCRPTPPPISMNRMIKNLVSKEKWEAGPEREASPGSFGAVKPAKARPPMMVMMT